MTFLLGMASLLLLLTGCESSCEDIYKKAMSLYQAGKYQKAVQLFEALLTRYPDHTLTPKAHYQLGNIYFYKLNQPERALEYVEKLYAQSPQGKYSIKALQLIGYIYDKSLNRCLDGAEAYQILVKDYSTDIDAAQYQLAIADCHFRLQNYSQAITVYEELTHDYPTSEHAARAQFQMANSYALTEECDRAVEIYESLLQSEGLPQQFIAEIKLELAYCYGQQEQYSKAVALYEDLEQFDARYVSLDSNLITRKKERTLKRLAEANRKPDEVDWTRRKK
jgi:TolA-binding protein